MTGNGRAAGLLLAMMEPSPTMEDEFQDWYDIEHFPERAEIDGFLTATRLICLDGWPRYLTLYDLTDAEVLGGDGYSRIAGKNYSKWTHRIVPRLWGNYRVEGTQIYPRAALFGEGGRASRIALWRFRDVPASLGETIVAGMRALYEGRAETAQLRVFRAHGTQGEDYFAIVELHAPWRPEVIEPLGAALRHLDMVNSYVCYNRG